jgi:hypothetical protein
MLAITSNTPNSSTTYYPPNFHPVLILVPGGSNGRPSPLPAPLQQLKSPPPPPPSLSLIPVSGLQTRLLPPASMPCTRHIATARSRLPPVGSMDSVTIRSQLPICRVLPVPSRPPWPRSACQCPCCAHAEAARPHHSRVAQVKTSNFAHHRI